MTMIAGLMRYVFGLNRLFSALFRPKKALKNRSNFDQKTYRITPIMLTTPIYSSQNLSD
jgi:hypothetical protein